MLCIASAGHLLALAATTFTLSWTHSVEHTRWRETWRLADDHLQLTEAMVEGPGAGIVIPDNAVMTPTGWLYHPTLPLQPRLLLAASGMTPSGWTLCASDECHELGARAGEEVELWAAATCEMEPPPSPR